MPDAPTRPPGELLSSPSVFSAVQFDFSRLKRFVETG